MIRELVHIRELNFAKAFNCFTNFQGLDEFITIQDSTATDREYTQAVTYSAWVFVPSSTSGVPVIISKYNFATPKGYFWAILTGSSRMRYQLRPDEFQYTDAYSNTGVIPTDEWCHIAVTDDGSGLRAGINFYVNGVNVGTDAVGQNNAGPGTMINAETVKIGAEPTLGWYMEGGIEDVGIFSRALTSTEISEMYNQGRLGPQYGAISNIVSYYSMSNLDYRDSIGGFNGTPTNMDVSNVVCTGVERRAHVELNGTDEYMKGGNSITQPYEFKPSNPFTLSAWVRRPLIGNPGPIISKRYLDSKGFYLRMPGDGSVEFDFTDGAFTAGRWLRIRTAAGVWGDNELVHLVLTYNGTGADTGCKIYINKVSIPFTTSSTPVSDPATTTLANLEFGAVTSKGWYLIGELHDCRIWRTVLTPTDIAGEYGLGDRPNGLPVQFQDLVAWNKCGEEVGYAGTTPFFADSSGAGQSFEGVNMDTNNIKYT